MKHEFYTKHLYDFVEMISQYQHLMSGIATEWNSTYRPVHCANDVYVRTLGFKWKDKQKHAMAKKSYSWNGHCTKVRNEYTANTITRFTKLCSFYRVLKRRIFPVWTDWIRFTFLKVNSGRSQGSFRIAPSSGVWNSSDSGWNCPRTILRVTSRIGSNFEQSLGSTHCSPQRLSKEQKRLNYTN